LSVSELFSIDRYSELWDRERLALGHPLTLKDVTESTNDDALLAAREGAPHGATFVAERQTKGRGRRGTAWHDQPGSTLTFSLLLRPSIALDRATQLTIVAGLAVRAVAELRLSNTPHVAKVKWPNDVVVGTRKLAGILVESQLRGDTLSAVVIGVGLNAGPMDFPRELDTRATSLANLGAASEREALLVEFLSQFSARVSSFEAGGTQWLEEVRRHDALFGQRVRVGELEGTARGIDDGGRLVVTERTGTQHRIATGHVEPLG
jgi:BirA family biotin operon repressor/biotin-[acetyl-CoA-carboxylase] ligase